MKRINHYTFQTILYLLLISFFGCISNSTITYQKNKRSSVNNFPNNDSLLRNSDNSILLNSVDIKEYLTSEGNANNNFFISLVNLKSGEYVEAKTKEMTNDSIKLDVSMKDFNKNESINFELGIDKDLMRIRNVKDVKNGIDILLELRTQEQEKDSSRYLTENFKIRKFNSSNIHEDVVHFYSGEILFENKVYSKFMIINDVTSTEPVLESLYYLFSFQFNREKINKECFDKLKESKCKKGVLSAVDFKPEKKWFGVQVNCKANCIENK